MSLDIGVNVVQYRPSSHRQGIIYKKKLDVATGWMHFEVLWASGERSIERADHLKTTADIENQFTDLVVLRDLQDSILAGGLYD